MRGMWMAALIASAVPAWAMDPMGGSSWPKGKPLDNTVETGILGVRIYDNTRGGTASVAPPANYNRPPQPVIYASPPPTIVDVLPPPQPQTVYVPVPQTVVVPVPVYVPRHHHRPHRPAYDPSVKTYTTR